MTIRQKPTEVNGHETIIPDLIWEYFDQYCEENGIGEHPDDYQPWLDCWMQAIYAYCVYSKKEGERENEPE